MILILEGGCELPVGVCWQLGLGWGCGRLHGLFWGWPALCVPLCKPQRLSSPVAIADVARRQRRRSGSAAAAAAAGNSASRRAVGYNEFFIQTVPVAPNRFRPVNHVGEMVSLVGWGVGVGWGGVGCVCVGWGGGGGGG